MIDNQATEAATLLHELLTTQTRLATEQAEANRLERAAVEQKQRELDLRDRQLALEHEAEKRRESRLNEVLQRLIKSDERMQKYVSQLVTTDDAFGETVQRIIEAHRSSRVILADVLMALLALLGRNNDDLRQSRPIITAQLELLQQQDNLDRLRLDAAKHGSIDVPLKLQNEIEATEARIEELTARIAAQRGAR